MKKQPKKPAVKIELDPKIEYLKRPETFSKSFLEKYEISISKFKLHEKLKIFSIYCGASSSFATEDAIRSGIKTPITKHFADFFIEKYEHFLIDFSLLDILKVFYVYKECNGQFSVESYIQKLKKVVK